MDTLGFWGERPACTVPGRPCLCTGGRGQRGDAAMVLEARGKGGASSSSFRSPACRVIFAVFGFVPRKLCSTEHGPHTCAQHLGGIQGDKARVPLTVCFAFGFLLSVVSVAWEKQEAGALRRPPPVSPQLAPFPPTSFVQSRHQSAPPLPDVPAGTAMQCLSYVGIAPYAIQSSITRPVRFILPLCLLRASTHQSNSVRVLVDL